MTVIAFDGVTIACDSKRTGDYADVWSDWPKFRVVGRGKNTAIVASAGDVAWCEAFDAWVGGKTRKYPAKAGNEGEAVVLRAGQWRRYMSDDEYPEPIGAKWAIGSGRNFAASALILKHDAITAVWAAMQLNEHCGGHLYFARVDEILKVGNAAIKKISEQGRTPYEVRSEMLPDRPGLVASGLLKRPHSRRARNRR